MATLSNSYVQRSFVEEINSTFLELLQISKKFLYKHHKILGYF
jgi:hypothetical protein